MEKRPPMFYFMYTVFIVAFILISFFGIGPVLLADGGMGERVITALVVILIYIVWGYLFLRWRRSNR